MSSTRWRTMESLFDRALGMPSSERDAFLQQAASGDSEIRNEVRRLLSLYEEDQEFMEARPVHARLGEGERLGDYLIEDALGEGGMGVVYRARHSESGAVVAIKALRPEALASPGMRKRFNREYQALASLNHPNIVRVHGLERDSQDHLFLIMELVEGSPLSVLLENATLSLETALDYARQIASALAAAHDAGLVHRDVKPQNLIVTPERTVKILDFGLCKWNRDEAGPGLSKTYSGLLLGTAPYMSPEQAQGLPVDQRSDVFSFGAVLYELLSGRPAFAASNVVATLAAILHEEPPELPGVPEEVVFVIRRCLRKNPAERYPSGRELDQTIRLLVERQRQGKLHNAPNRPWGPAWRWAALTGLTVATGGLLWRVVPWLSDWNEPLRSAVTGITAGDPNYRVVSLTSSLRRWVVFPAFSPDGRQIAYAVQEAGNYDIYVQQIETGTVLRLTSDPASDRCPAWSPDGNYIAFLRSTPKEAGFYLVPSSGGAERKLAPAAPELHEALSRTVDWFPDGKSLAITDKTTAGEPFRIVALSIGTGDRRDLTSPPAGSPGDTNAAISPDGKLLLFDRKKTPGVGDLYVAPASGGEPRRLTFDGRGLAGAAWTPDSRSIVFASNRAGTMYSLWRVPLSGSPVERLPFGEEAYYPTISRKGNRLAYTRALIRANLFRIPLAGKSEGEVLTASSRIDLAAQYSPDGKRLVFISSRSGSAEIWVSDAEGRNERQITSFRSAFMNMPRWSPDGAQVTFSSCEGGNCDIYVASSEGGAPRRLTMETSEEMTPCWSADGRWIFYASNRGSQWQIWRVPASGGAPPTQVTRRGGFAPQTSGQYVYFAKGPDGYFPRNPDAAGLWRIPAHGGDETPVIGSLKPWIWRYFSVLDEHIYFIDEEFNGQRVVVALKRFDMHTRRTTRLLELKQRPPTTHAGVAFYEGLAISPDRRWAVHPQSSGASSSDILMGENFR